MLDECEHVTLTSTWKEVRRKIKHDSRFSKLSEDDKVGTSNRPNQEILLPDWVITSHVT